MEKHVKEQIEREVVRVAAQSGAEDQKKNEYNPPIKWYDLCSSDEKIIKQQAYDAGWEASKKK